MGLNENERRAIEQLYKEMLDSLAAYAQSALNDRSFAEEAVQDTFRIACAKANAFLSSPNPKGWLLNTLKYVIKNTIRTRANLNRINMSTLDFDENTVAVEMDTSKVDFMYSDLAIDKDYKLLMRIALDKYSMFEAAQELEISIEACKKRVQRAKKKLKRRLEEKNIYMSPNP